MRTRMAPPPLGMSSTAGGDCAGAAGGEYGGNTGGDGVGAEEGDFCDAAEGDGGNAAKGACCGVVESDSDNGAEGDCCGAAEGHGCGATEGGRAERAAREAAKRRWHDGKRYVFVMTQHKQEKTVRGQ